MICSEFAGCNEAMNGVLKYNPFSLDGFVKIMDQAMSLNSDERMDNMELCYSQIKKNSLSKWAEEFLKDLKLAYKPVKTSYYLGINFG
jgi:trehalose-6-phosphate synthase